MKVFDVVKEKAVEGLEKVVKSIPKLTVYGIMGIGVGLTGEKLVKYGVEAFAKIKENV